MTKSMTQTAQLGSSLTRSASNPLLWQSIGWKVASCACFAGMNGVVRYLTGGAPIDNPEPLPVNVIVFFEYALAMLLLIPFEYQAGIQALKTKRISLHSARVIAAVIGVCLWYLGLKYLPIAEVVALSFMGPVVTLIGAKLVLKEDLNPKRWLAIALSFLGAFFISRPDTNFNVTQLSFGWAIFFPMLAASFFATSKLITRRLAELGESPQLLTGYLLFFMAPVALFPAMFTWVTPNLWHWPWLILLGALTLGAHYSFSKAYSLAEITLLMPIGSVKFIFSMIIGYLAFAEWPQSVSTWVGILIIAMATMLVNASGVARRQTS